jgi:hypothetical protein
MNQYLLCFYQPAGDPPPPEVLGKIMRELEAVNRDIKAAGAWVLAGGLRPAQDAKVARVKNGVIVVTDGPFAETKEFLGGICIIKAPDFETAVAWGSRIAQATTLPIEVRPFQEPTQG